MDTPLHLADTLQSAGHELERLQALSEKLSASLVAAFAGGIARGKGFEEVLKQVGQQLEQTALKASLQPLQQLFSSGLGAATSGLGAALASALGGALGGDGGGEGSLLSGPVMRAASGAVLTTPTYFPTAGGMGLAGEAGAEAVLPLERSGDGRLGVRASGEARPVSVTVNVTTPDAAGFMRSQAQVSAAVARAVARGRRAL